MDHARKKVSSFCSVLTAIVFALVIVIAGCLFTALLINREVVDADSLGYWVMGILFLAGLAGGIIIVAKAQEKILARGCLVGISLFFVLLCIGALFFDGPLSGVWQTALLLTGSCLSAILVGTHRKDPVKPRRHRIRNG